MAVETLLDQAAAAQREGRLSEAEIFLRQALQEDPKNFRSAVALSVNCRVRGEMQAGAEAARSAIAIRSHAMEGHLQLGLCLLAQGMFAEAEAALLEAIKIKPNLAPLYHNLGLCRENSGNLGGAAEAFRTAMRLDPRDVRSRISLGSLLLADFNLELATECAQGALRLDPNSADANSLMAKIMTAKRQDAEAEKYMRRALQLNPESSSANSHLGFRLLQKGSFEQSEQFFRKSLELDPEQGASYFGITQGRRITDSDLPLIAQMEEVQNRGGVSYEERGFLSFALAKAYDNLGRSEEALTSYHGAHHFSYFAKGGQPIDRAAVTGEIDSTIEIYAKGLLDSVPPCRFASDLPIFIVGMMRSGTTLTEQIISSHPVVAGAGENWFWPQRANQADDRVKMTFNPEQALSLAREYCRELRRVSSSAKRITDKLPGNYKYLGLLHLALPNAKIVHVRRNPIDTALSIYFTPNLVADFAHSLDDIAFVYREYLRLMDHWRSLIPRSHFFEVVYEELVDDPEPVIRKMIEFCGLDWDDACLHHDRNEKAVRTPSLWQVRQPMYKTSAGRWKRYEPWIGDLVSQLGNA